MFFCLHWRHQIRRADILVGGGSHDLALQSAKLAAVQLLEFLLSLDLFGDVLLIVVAPPVPDDAEQTEQCCQDTSSHSALCLGGPVENLWPRSVSEGVA